MLDDIEYYTLKLQARDDYLTKVSKLINCYVAKNAHNLLKGIKGKTIGCGAFGKVFEFLVNPTICIKTFPVGSEDAYGDYLKWVLDNQHSKYVPKIHKVLQVGEEKVVFIEKLNDGVSNPVSVDVYNVVGQTIRGTGTKDFKALEKYGEDFMDFVVTLCDVFKDYNLDLHTGNIMFREDGTPVITDPLFTKKELYETVSTPTPFKFPKILPSRDKKQEVIPKFKFKNLQIPKFKVHVEHPIWQKDNKWA